MSCATTGPAGALLSTGCHHTWLGVDSETAAHAATERTRGGLPSAPAPGHSYYDYNVALSMVAGGLGIAIVPALAVREAVPDGVKAVSLPGLGTRTLIARHRTTRSEPRKEVVTVLDAIVTLAAGLDVAMPWTVESPHPS